MGTSNKQTKQNKAKQPQQAKKVRFRFIREGVRKMLDTLKYQQLSHFLVLILTRLHDTHIQLNNYLLANFYILSINCFLSSCFRTFQLTKCPTKSKRSRRNLMEALDHVVHGSLDPCFYSVRLLVWSLMILTFLMVESLKSRQLVVSWNKPVRINLEVNVQLDNFFFSYRRTPSCRERMVCFIEV